MSQLSHEEKMIYTDLFLRLDGEEGNGDGALTIDEYEKLLISCGFRLPRELVATSFVSMDTDGNWKITLDEYLANLPKLVAPEPQDFVVARLRRVFDDYDTDKNGVVTAEELWKVLKKAGVVDDDTIDEIKTVIADCDTDGDGQLNFEEFIKFYILIGLDDSDLDGEEEEEDNETEKQGETTFDEANCNPIYKG